MIPQYLIEKVGGRPGGAHLPVRPKPSYTPAVTPLPISAMPTGKVYDDLTLQRMEFDNWEYRFWCADMEDGVRGSELVSICRVCSSIFYERVSRQNHLNGGCSNSLLAAYKLLLLDKKCVVCDTRTSEQKWGVPLCKNQQCHATFKHVDPTPQALSDALDLVAKGHKG